MRNYWSCSKFADWVRGMPKPLVGTCEEWKAWEKTAKEKRFRYWLAENGLDHLQDIIFFPVTCLNDLRYYIKNRWVNKTHALTSKLKRGEWHEFDSRLLYSAFEELVNFVEIELAWQQIIFSGDEDRKYNPSWYVTAFRIWPWRCPEAGIANLIWASELKNDEEWFDKNGPDYGKPTKQALAAQETLALYRWWKEGRPNRPDPGEASGWNKYYEEASRSAKDNDGGLFSFTKREISQDSLNSNKLYHQMEDEQEEEDTAMLVRLVKHRRNIWT